MTTKATVKGLVLIPAPLRRRFGIQAGTSFDIREEKGRIVLQPITREFVRQVRGMLKGSGSFSHYLREKKRDLEREEKGIEHWNRRARSR